MSRPDSVLLVLSLTLAGASTSSLAQAAMVAASIDTGLTGSDPMVLFLMWGWIAASALAVACGLIGGYQAIQSQVVSQPAILVFLVLYSITVRIDRVSLGWPWQFHLGIVLGRVGLGINVVGALLLLWFVKAANRSESGAPSRSCAGNGEP